jgi:mono/diheme cytochrome c family protein
VARGHLREDSYLYTGRVPGLQGTGPAEYVTRFPFPISREDLDRGQERFDIYCSVCHGRLGYGDGMITRRGFRRPSSYHDQRLREAPVGYLYDVITNGYGAMSDYAAQVPVEDRWRIIAYIRTLQFSQNASLDDVPAAERAELGD